VGKMTIELEAGSLAADGGITLEITVLLRKFCPQRAASFDVCSTIRSNGNVGHGAILLLRRW
jgi:hypothetical protein